MSFYFGNNSKNLFEDPKANLTSTLPIEFLYIFIDKNVDFVGTKTINMKNYQNIKAILTLKLEYPKFKARLNDEMNGNGLTTFLIASLIYYIGTQIMGQFS